MSQLSAGRSVGWINEDAPSDTLVFDCQLQQLPAPATTTTIEFSASNHVRSAAAAVVVVVVTHFEATRVMFNNRLGDSNGRASERAAAVC